MAKLTTEQLDTMETGRRGFTTEELDAMESVPQIEIDPEVIAKKRTSEVFGTIFGLDEPTATTTYDTLVKKMYGENLKPSQVQKMLEQDGFQISPDADEKDVIEFSTSMLERKESTVPADRQRREANRQIYNVFRSLQLADDIIFDPENEWYKTNIATKPAAKEGVLYSEPVHETENLLDFDTYASLLEKSATRENVEDLRRERKALVARVYNDALEQNADYYDIQEWSEFSTGSKVGDVTLEAAKGVYTALKTIEKGVWSTSVAMGMAWNQPELARVEATMKDARLTPMKAAGKIGYVTRAMSEAVPNFAYNMTVGNAGIFITEYGNARSDALNDGATEFVADAIAMVVAPINTIIEGWQIDKIFKIAGLGKGAKQAVKKAIKDRAYKAFLRGGAKFTGQSVLASINEGIEGFAQEGVSIAVPGFIIGNYPKDENGRIDWAGIMTQMGQSFVGEGLGGLLMGTGGAIYNARNVQNYKHDIALNLIVNEGMESKQALEIATNIVERLKNNEATPKEIYRQEVGKVKMADNRAKAAAHIIKRGKEMPDEQYRRIAMNATGKESLVDMTYEEGEKFIDALNKAKVEKVEREEGQVEEEVTEQDIAREIEEIKQSPEVVSVEKPPQVTPPAGVTPEIEPTGIAPGARAGLPAVEAVETGAVQPAVAGVAAAKAGPGAEDVLQPLARELREETDHYVEVRKAVLEGRSVSRADLEKYAAEGYDWAKKLLVKEEIVQPAPAAEAQQAERQPWKIIERRGADKAPVKWQQGEATITVEKRPKTKSGLGGRRYVVRGIGETEYGATTLEEAQRWAQQAELLVQEELTPEKYPVQEVPVKSLKLSKDVPQFKEAAKRETGVVPGEELQGQYTRLGTGAIVVWERKTGDLEVITGRHRLDLARRMGEKTIPAQVVKESEGFTREMALTIDAESNIREGQGSIRDYVEYFRNTRISEEDAGARGLLARAKGKVGFVIGKSAGDDVYTAFANKRLPEDKAYAIASSAPGNKRAQQLALMKSKELSADELREFTRMVARMKPSDALKPKQSNLFGFDESAIEEAEIIAKTVSQEVASLKDRVLAVKGALRRPEVARKMGLEFTDEESIRKEVERLENRIDDLSRVSTTPALYKEMRIKAGLEEPEKARWPKRGGFLNNTPFGNKGKLRQKVDEVLLLLTKPKKPPVAEAKKSLKELKRTDTLTTFKNVAEDAVASLDRAFGIMSTRIKNISQKLFQEVRNKYINPVKMIIADRTQKVHPFVDAIEKQLSESDRYDWEVARWTEDVDTIERIIGQYGLQEAYDKYRLVFDLMYHEGKAVGMDMNYMTAYFPSKVKDINGLLKELNRREEYAPIVKALQEAQDKKGRPLGQEEQIQILDTLLRGYRTTGVSLTPPGFTRTRTLVRDDIGLIKYYYGFAETTSRYIESMTENIQARKFFGKQTKEIVDLRANISRQKTNIAKWEKDTTKDRSENIQKAKEKIVELETKLRTLDDGTLNASVGAYVLDLIEDGTINYDQQVELRQIFEGLFNNVGTNRWVHTLRSLEYVSSLAQIPALVTQYSEVVLSVLNAPGTTLPNWVRAHLNKSKINLHEIGVAHIGQEWADADFDATMTNLMKLFEKVDKIGKETFINSVVDKYRKLAKTNPDKVKEELAKYYPEAEHEAIIQSLISGVVDNNIKGFALNELADVQPISKMEVPELYAKAGNLRVFYMYKTFTLKRLDIMRNQAYNDIKTGIKSGSHRQILKGLGKLVWLALMFTLADSSADIVKDIIRGKPLQEIPDYVVDNLLQMILLSKYSASKVRTEGPSSFFRDNIALPVSTVDAAARDIGTLMDEDSEKGSELARRIPWMGDLYYWHFGEGARKVEEGYYE